MKGVTAVMLAVIIQTAPHVSLKSPFLKKKPGRWRRSSLCCVIIEALSPHWDDNDLPKQYGGGNVWIPFSFFLSFFSCRAVLQCRWKIEEQVCFLTVLTITKNKVWEGGDNMDGLPTVQPNCFKVTLESTEHNASRTQCHVQMQSRFWQRKRDDMHKSEAERSKPAHSDDANMVAFSNSRWVQNTEEIEWSDASFTFSLAPDSVSSTGLRTHLSLSNSCASCSSENHTRPPRGGTRRKKKKDNQRIKSSSFIFCGPTATFGRSCLASCLSVMSRHELYDGLLHRTIRKRHRSERVWRKGGNFQ